MFECKNKVVEPVTVKTKDNHLGGTEYKHPSFGIASFSRVSGDRQNLYGSKILNSNTIELTVSTSSCTQSLGRDWYHDDDIVVQVTFTQTQFAELLTNMNSIGVPCTLSYREALGHITSAEIPHELEYIKDKIQQQKDSQQGKLRLLQDEVSALLTKKGTLKKDEKERLLKITQQMSDLSSSEIPFYVKSAEEVITKATQEAKAEVEAFNLHAVTALGLKALEDIDLVKRLLNKE